MTEDEREVLIRDLIEDHISTNRGYGDEGEGHDFGLFLDLLLDRGWAPPGHGLIRSATDRAVERARAFDAGVLSGMQQRKALRAGVREAALEEAAQLVESHREGFLHSRHISETWKAGWRYATDDHAHHIRRLIGGKA